MLAFFRARFSVRRPRLPSAVLALGYAAFVALGVVSCRSGDSAETVAFFRGLGDLPGGAYSSLALGVSADGTVVVGQSEAAEGLRAFVWRDGMMRPLANMPGGGPATEARAASADGSVIVGTGRFDSGAQAVFWTGDEVTVIGDLPGGIVLASAIDVSLDGRSVIGYSASEAGLQGFLWAGGVLRGLTNLNQDPSIGRGLAISPDGRTVVGQSHGKARLSQAVRWVGDALEPLGFLDGRQVDSAAADASADGSVVVGVSRGELEVEAYRLEAGQMVGLGDLPGGKFFSLARAVSADGSVVVGKGTDARGAQAFVWTKPTGLEALAARLERACGLDLSGWSLTDGRDLSARGDVIVGFGVNPQGATESWIAKLRDPACLKVPAP